MENQVLSVRELEEQDLDALMHYWFGADKAFLEGMGVDLTKMPDQAEWRETLRRHVQTPLEEKPSYCLIWQADGQAVGHSNVNKIVPGQEASMHLHLWNSGLRQKGLGTAFVKMTLPYFFHNLKLKSVYAEPYALNPAPHQTLEKAGFQLVKEYTTTPGWINFEQPVKRWEMTQERFNSLV
ncbi:GNAT family N-acetyltransferase [Rufibacter hautae]|uniref:GNAT family N-acetyltransferase n=1 Tax=Rufibacter hautae TaxID=2595005 RepID=A0A5B6TDI1_9BACT|nr:GNAT family protein [Rufibacter hautae]KAA3437074.1 GNAT family N-acetyltransferase [Rufibacter hautae]